ncbi:MAG: glycosidase [Pyrodictiaceae archaeon]
MAVNSLERYLPKIGVRFELAEGFSDSIRLRKPETRDIVERIGVIPPYHVFLNNFPLRNPAAVFNPALFINHKEEYVRIYARIIVGYYKYVSAITDIQVPLKDVLESTISSNYYASTIVIYPSSKYDRWGAEDPRLYEIDGTIYMTYVGRTVNYFNPIAQRERTLPITAIYKGNDTWDKRIVHKPPKSYADFTISDKDAYLFKAHGRLWLFHRPHIEVNGQDFFMLLISRLEPLLLEKAKKANKILEVESTKPVMVTAATHFESKVGWATPPIKLSDRKLIALVHGVDAELVSYRVFAIELELPRSEDENVVVTAVTPQYIMAPQRNYEVFGDMPGVIFPTGLWSLEKDKYLIAYGAADFMIGLGLIDLNTLLGELDKGRIF